MSAPPVVAHLIADFSAKEAMGRTITETATRVPGTHHLVTATAHDGLAAFASVHQLGGGLATFPLGRIRQLTQVLDQIRPDLVHVHAGALGALQVALPALRHRRTVLTVYAWPTLPGPGTWRRASFAELLASNVLAPRVALTTVLPPGSPRRSCAGPGSPTCSPRIRGSPRDSTGAEGCTWSDCRPGHRPTRAGPPSPPTSQ